MFRGRKDEWKYHSLDLPSPNYVSEERIDAKKIVGAADSGQVALRIRILARRRIQPATIHPRRSRSYPREVMYKREGREITVVM